HRAEGGAVPARHRDGLQGRKTVRAVHLQQSEPDRGMRMRRIGPARAGERSVVARAISQMMATPSGQAMRLQDWREPARCRRYATTNADGTPRVHAPPHPIALYR